MTTVIEPSARQAHAGPSAATIRDWRLARNALPAILDWREAAALLRLPEPEEGARFRRGDWSNDYGLTALVVAFDLPGRWGDGAQRIYHRIAGWRTHDNQHAIVHMGNPAPFLKRAETVYQPLVTMTTKIALDMVGIPGWIQIVDDVAYVDATRPAASRQSRAAR